MSRYFNRPNDTYQREARLMMLRDKLIRHYTNKQAKLLKLSFMANRNTVLTLVGRTDELDDLILKVQSELRLIARRKQWRA